MTVREIAKLSGVSPATVSRFFTGAENVSPELREKVNALVHPAVKTYILEESAREKEAERLDLFVVEAALLIEGGYKEHVDALWYIYCDENERRRRLRATRGYSDEKIDGILKSQLSEQKFREAADVVIDNSTTLDAAFAQVDAALTKDGIMRRIPLQKKDV